MPSEKTEEATGPDPVSVQRLTSAAVTVMAQPQRSVLQSGEGLILEARGFQIYNTAPCHLIWGQSTVIELLEKSTLPT